MPSTNCISPCMIRDDSDEKPNSDGSTLPPFLAPPFFFPAAWKPSSPCCFAPFLPPALFVQEGMGQERGQMCVVGSESASSMGVQGRRVMAVLGVRIQIRTSLCIMSASFSHFVLLVIAPPSKGQAPAPSPSQGSVCVCMCKARHRCKRLCLRLPFARVLLGATRRPLTHRELLGEGIHRFALSKVHGQIRMDLVVRRLREEEVGQRHVVVAGE